MWLFAVCQNNILLDFLKDEISLERKLNGTKTEKSDKHISAFNLTYQHFFYIYKKVELNSSLSILVVFASINYMKLTFVRKVRIQLKFSLDTFIFLL